MILIVLVFLAGVLTILSPCILPVLPFVFARSERRFVTAGLPMLLGMAATFAGIASLAAVGGAWAVRVNQYGRLLALAVLTAFALTLLSTRLADLLARPFVALGNRLAPASPAGEGGVTSSVTLGVATGLLWAPCAGPILGLVLTGAALSGPNTHTTFLLFAYAAGAATSLGAALLAGGRVFALLKRSLGAGEWIRRSLGAAILLAVVAIAMGWDGTVLTRLSLAGTNRLEQSLLDRIGPGVATPGAAVPGVLAPGARAPTVNAADLPVDGPLPSLSGATAWLNSPALTVQQLRGKVVLIDFWTYSCINCLRSLPYVQSWYEKYKEHGLVVIGVHAPEFAFEKQESNVRRAVSDLGIRYPVAIDNDYAIWRGFSNHYWPAHYFIDAEGRIRGHRFGEGDYDGTEMTLRALLTAAGYTDLPAPGTRPARAGGALAEPDIAHDLSEETYLGYRRASGFASPGGLVRDGAEEYGLPPALSLNQWALAGRWTDDAEKAVLVEAPGRIEFRFQARDLHLVLGPGAGGRPARFRVLLDGLPPGADHGVDADENGDGVVDSQRLYQLIRQSGPVREHVFSIEFEDAGIAAYSFTFG